MKNPRRRAVALCCVLLVLAGCPLGGTTLYQSEEGRFEVLMPSDREEVTERVVIPSGELEARSVVGRISDLETFGVLYIDVPVRAGDITTDLAFEWAISGTLAGESGLEVTRQETTFAYGGPAEDYVLESEDRRVLARLAIVKRRIYLLQYQGPNNDVTEDRYYRYADTFDLVDPEVQ